MANLSKVQLPNGSVLDVWDDSAHTLINNFNTNLSSKADLVEGKIPANQLPSYVDDVLEYSNLAAFPEAGESGKIYITLDTNKTYRWSGTTYVEISESLAIGTTASTAAAGNHTHSAAAIGAIAAPDTPGTEGQVLTLDENLNPIWQTSAADDTKVTQTVSTDNNTKPLLFAQGNTTATSTTTFTTQITGNAASGNLNATSYTVENSEIAVTKTETGGWIWAQDD